MAGRLAVHPSCVRCVLHFAVYVPCPCDSPCAALLLCEILTAKCPLDRDGSTDHLRRTAVGGGIYFKVHRPSAYAAVCRCAGVRGGGAVRVKLRLRVRIGASTCQRQGGVVLLTLRSGWQIICASLSHPSCRGHDGSFGTDRCSTGLGPAFNLLLTTVLCAFARGWQRMPCKGEKMEYILFLSFGGHPSLLLPVSPEHAVALRHSAPWTRL